MRLIRNIISFYVEGFRNQSRVSRKLWLIILIKLFIMFVILRLFLFPNFLNSKYNTDEEKSKYVIENLTNQKN